jgi:hypothetical protein
VQAQIDSTLPHDGHSEIARTGQCGIRSTTNILHWAAKLVMGQEERAMKTHNVGSSKIAVLRGCSFDDVGWFGRAALLLLGSALVYGLLCVPANAEAAKPPPRIANIYDGFDHQPTHSEVEDRERAAGSCPNAWCRSEAPEQRWLRVQAAMAGRLTVALSLTDPRVSRVI